MTWITIKTTEARWEAEFMQQMLMAHDIPVRIVNQGAAIRFGCDSPLAVQVPPQAQWTALLLLSPIEDHLQQ